MRSYIIRSLLASGFTCDLGIKHHNIFNSFNLADDLIEPWRAMVDLVAYGNIGRNVRLTFNQRKDIACVLHNNCQIDDKIMQISTGIDVMVASFKQSVMGNNSEWLKLPVLVGTELK